jgi:hypothetical protein
MEHPCTPVVYYCLVFDVSLAVACYLIPSNTLADSTAIYWAGFLIVISIIALVAWLIYLLRFNVFKRFGEISVLNTLFTFILFFIATGFILSFAYIPAWIETVKANRDFDGEQVVKDINQMNLDLCRLEYHDLPLEWDNDTLAVVDTLPKRNYYDADEYEAAEAVTGA